MTKFSFDEAKARLSLATRDSLVDHAFGDAEVYWSIGGNEIAGGYFGRSASVGLDATEDREATEFHHAEAEELRYCGTRGTVDRNDNSDGEFGEGMRETH